MEVYSDLIMVLYYIMMSFHGNALENATGRDRAILFHDVFASHSFQYCNLELQRFQQKTLKTVISQCESATKDEPDKSTFIVIVPEHTVHPDVEQPDAGSVKMFVHSSFYHQFVHP